MQCVDRVAGLIAAWCLVLYDEVACWFRDRELKEDEHTDRGYYLLTTGLIGLVQYMIS